MSHRLRLRVAALCLFAIPRLAAAQIVFTLNNSFIRDFKSRVTIDAMFTVDTAHAHPNTAKKDADLHVAGRAPEIGLPTVAEIMNAAEAPEAVDKIHEVQRSHTPIKITGAWRIWPEHGGHDDEQVQGTALDPFMTTNPPHIFEIHPITKVGTISTSSSIHFIAAGFRTKDAEDSFTRFENHRSKLTFDAARKTTTIETPMIGNNYVEFMIELNETPRPVADGLMVFAKVMTLDGDLLVHKRRMVFIGGTDEAELVKNKRAGDTFRVLGIPRVDLSLVWYRTHPAEQQPKDKKRSKELLTWNLPYEMIIVAAEPVS